MLHSQKLLVSRPSNRSSFSHNDSLIIILLEVDCSGNQNLLCRKCHTCPSMSNGLIRWKVLGVALPSMACKTHAQKHSARPSTLCSELLALHLGSYPVACSKTLIGPLMSLHILISVRLCIKKLLWVSKHASAGCFDIVIIGHRQGSLRSAVSATIVTLLMPPNTNLHSTDDATA